MHSVSIRRNKPYLTPTEASELTQQQIEEAARKRIAEIEQRQAADPIRWHDIAVIWIGVAGFIVFWLTR